MEFYVLYDACLEGNIRKLKRILSRKEINVNELLDDISSELPKGSTILHAVLKKAGKTFKLNMILEMMKLLLEHGVEVNSVNKNGESPLTCAIEFKSVELVHLLCEFGAIVPICSRHGLSPVETAFFLENLKMITVLFESKNLVIDDNEDSFAHQTEKTYFEDYLALVRSIIQDDVDTFNNLVNKIDNVNFEHLKAPSPLYVAVTYDKDYFAKMLIRKGAQIYGNFSRPIAVVALKLKRIKIFKMLLKSNLLDVNTRYEGTPLLIVALGWNKLDIVKLLLKNGIDVNGTNKDLLNINPLHWAVCKEKESVVRLLLSYNADIEAKCGKHEYTPLLMAIFSFNSTLVHMLLKKGAALNYTSQFLETPLIAAVLMNDIKIVKLICKYGADVNFPNKDGHTALHAAVARDVDLRIIKILFKYEADPNIGDYKASLSSFLVACLKSDVEVVKMLLLYNADVHHCDKFGNTSIHFLAGNDLSGPLEYVLENFPDIDVNAHNCDGVTPLHICSKSCAKMLMLLEKGGDVNMLSNDLNYVTLPLECRQHDCPVISHLNKLQLLGYEVNGMTANSYESHDKNSTNKHCLIECQKELENFKNEVINTYPKTTLYDFLFMKLNDTSKYCENNILREIYMRNGEDFRNEFPHYGYLLNLHYKKGMSRRAMLIAAKKILNQAWERKLSDYCVERILTYLDNYQLKKFEDKLFDLNLNNLQNVCNLKSDIRVTRGAVKRLKVD